MVDDDEPDQNMSGGNHQDSDMTYVKAPSNEPLGLDMSQFG